MGKQPAGPMEEREGDVRWDGLCSRDAATRAAALDTIGQAVLRRSETVAPVAAVPPTRAADGLPVPAARDGLSEVLARLLMLSKRCPFPDVREKSEEILGEVQVSTADPRRRRGTGPGELRSFAGLVPGREGTFGFQLCSEVGIRPRPVRFIPAVMHANCSPPREETFGKALLKGREKSVKFLCAAWRRGFSDEWLESS